MSAIFDASVVVKWFVDDPLSLPASEARLMFRPALAPSVVMVEVASALRRHVVQGPWTRPQHRTTSASCRW